MRRAGFTYVALGVLQRGLSLLLLPFVTRAMSVEEYGAVSVVVALGAFATALVGTPIQAPVTRWSAKKLLTRGEKQALQSARGWSLIAAPSILIVLAGVILLLPDRPLGVPAVLLCGEIMAAGLGLHLTFFTLPFLRGKGRLQLYVLVASVFIAVSVVGKIVLVIAYPLGAAGWVLSDVIAAIVGYATSAAVNKSEPVGMRKRGVRTLAAFSTPLIAQSLTTWAMQSLSRPLAALVMPLGQVGIYAASLNAVGAAMIIIFEFNKSSVVVFSRSTIGRPTRDVRTAIQTQRTLGLVVTVLTLAASPLFVAIVLPPEYSTAVAVLSVLALSPWLVALYDLPMNYLVYSQADTKWSWLPTAAGAMVQAAGVLALAPIAGALGAAVGTVIAYTTMTTLAFVVLHARGHHAGWRKIGLRRRDGIGATIAIVPLLYCSVTPVPPQIFIVAVTFSAAVIAVVIWADRRSEPDFGPPMSSAP